MTVIDPAETEGDVLPPAVWVKVSAWVPTARAELATEKVPSEAAVAVPTCTPSEKSAIVAPGSPVPSTVTRLPPVPLCVLETYTRGYAMVKEPAGTASESEPP